MTTANPHLQRWSRGLDILASAALQATDYQRSGRITRATGIVLEAVGLRLPLGAGCRIELLPASDTQPGIFAEAQVIGFSGDVLYLMPLEEIHGLQSGARVFALADEPGASDGIRPVPLGISLLGRVLDSSGNPFDGKGPLLATHRASLHGQPINPLQRAPIDRQIDVGIRAINALLSVGRGQRLGLFAGSGVGKSVLLGMMARYTRADVVVVGLIGERGREVQDFIDNILGEEGLRRSVVVAAPADASPLQRLQGALYATRLAEDFRDQGKDVLLIMDSLTRYAMAQREIALALGEPPATKGYPPSVFAKLPKLVERAGNGPRGGGSITGFYTVLSEGDDQQDPIADSARAILDGHFVLSRQLAESGHYPAIDIEASISRAMTAIVSESQQRKTQKLKQALSRYQRNRDLIGVGAYVPGHDAQLDRAVNLYPHIERFLQQRINERSSMEDSLAGLNLLFPGK